MGRLLAMRVDDSFPRVETGGEMTRHELAKLRFDQLAAGLPLGADELRSDQWEAWLRDDVVPPFI